MAGVGRPRPGTIGLVLAASLLGGFYVWTASAGRSLGFGQPQDRPYNLLAQALLRGQLHLAVEPRPELFELTEPYRPGRNAAYRYHDASLYHGRYYLYFGVVPVLTAFLPWRLLGLGDLPEPAAAAAFALAGFVFSGLLLRHLLRAHLDRPPGRVAWLLALLVLGLANVTPFILRSAHVYEVAIAAGYAFAVAAAWLFATARAGDVLSLRRLVLGGLALGLAVGCRPNLVFLAPVLPLLALPPSRPASVRAALRPVLAVLGPLVLCGLGLGLYNVARFGSFTEFGTRYQLVGIEPIAQFESRAIVPTLYYDFLAPPALRLDFPFVFADHDWGAPLPEGYFLDSSTTGAFLHSPFLLVLFALPWILRGAAVREEGALRRQLLLLVAGGLVVPLLTAFAFASTAMRFQADFVHLLDVPALVLWFVLVARLEARRRRVARALAVVVFGWSAFAAVALSITGKDPLRRSNPALFASLEESAMPLRRLAGLFARGTGAAVPLRVAFPERLAADEEPFLSWGTVEDYDVLWVRTLSPGVFAFSLDTATRRAHAPGARPSSEGVGFAPGRFYDVTVDVDRVARRVAVSVDGAERVELRGSLVPATPRQAWPGRGPRGSGARNIGHFSGTMIPEDMWLAGPPGLDMLPPIAQMPATVTASRDTRPEVMEPGRLWAVAGHRGAYLRTAEGWRWIPTATLDSVRLDRRLERPLPAWEGDVLPILFAGGAHGGVAVVLHRLSGIRAAIALARWEGSLTLGPQSAPLSLDAVAGRRLEVILDRRSREVVVRLGDREVLRAEADLEPLRPEHLLVGRMPARARAAARDDDEEDAPDDEGGAS